MDGGISQHLRNLSDGVLTASNQFFAFFQFLIVDVFNQADAFFSVKESGEVRHTEVDVVGDIGDGDGGRRCFLLCNCTPRR